MSSYSMNSPFLTFEESGHFFVFDVGNGDLLEVQQIYYDIIRYLNLYNIYEEEDVSALVYLFRNKYPEASVRDTIEDLKKNNKQGFLHKRGLIYSLYEEKIKKEKKCNSLWLNISHDCNLRCEYCFGNGGDYGSRRILMDEKTAKNCIDKWFAQVDLNVPILEVNFFGGEPLMNQDVMIYCVNYINNLFAKNKNQIRYNITTNGTIVNETLLNLFKENHFKISISIDGIERLHNLKRKYVSGKGSFADIARNVRRFKEYIPKLTAQITLTKEGIPHLSDAVMELWDMGINMVYSNLVFDETENYTYEHYRSYHDEIRKLSKLTYDNLMEKKPYTFQSLINETWAIRTKRFTTNCFFWGGGGMIFSPTGERYRCYRFMENDKYKISDNEDELLIEKPYIEKCAGCWAQLLCADGCVYENSVYSTDLNKPAEEWCSKIKISLEESLKFYTRLVINSPETLEMIFGR